MAVGYTPYSSQNQTFSNQAHAQAREDIYPLIFNRPKDQLRYPQLDDAQKRDYDMGIDRTIGVEVAGLHAPIHFSVQERFRRPRYAECRDVTFTVVNHNSGLLSELHKIEAAMMLYGYFDLERHQFIEAICLRVPIFKEYLVQGTLPFETGLNHRSNQTFYGFKFDDLLKLPGAVKFHKKW